MVLLNEGGKVAMTPSCSKNNLQRTGVTISISQSKESIIWAGILIYITSYLNMSELVNDGMLDIRLPIEKVIFQTYCRHFESQDFFFFFIVVGNT